MIVGAEIVASFTRVADEVARHAKIPVGLEVLLNDWRASLANCKVNGATFVRLDFFVDRVRIAAGIIDPEPEAVVIAYRNRLGAEGVALFTDIQVKYSELLEPGKPIEPVDAASHIPWRRRVWFPEMSAVTRPLPPTCARFAKHGDFRC